MSCRSPVAFRGERRIAAEGCNAVNDELCEFLDREWDFDLVDLRNGTGEGEQPYEMHDAVRLPGEDGRVRGEEVPDKAIGLVMTAAAARRFTPDSRHDAKDTGEAGSLDGDNCGHLRLQLVVRVDCAQSSPHRLGIEEFISRRSKQSLFVAERAKNGALRDAGGFGDLPRSHISAMFDEQRNDRVENHFTTIVGREGRRASGGGCWHRSKLHE
jgi:hypothetical protein